MFRVSYGPVSGVITPTVTEDTNKHCVGGSDDEETCGGGYIYRAYREPECLLSSTESDSSESEGEDECYYYNGQNYSEEIEDYFTRNGNEDEVEQGYYVYDFSSSDSEYDSSECSATESESEEYSDGEDSKYDNKCKGIANRYIPDTLVDEKNYLVENDIHGNDSENEHIAYYLEDLKISDVTENGGNRFEADKYEIRDYGGYERNVSDNNRELDYSFENVEGNNDAKNNNDDCEYHNFCGDDDHEYETSDSDDNDYGDEYFCEECDVSDYDLGDEDNANSDLSIKKKELAYSDIIANSKKDISSSAFFGFYEHLQNHLMSKFSVSDHTVRRSIQRLIYNYSNLSLCKTPEELDFNDISNCVGYLHRYGICHTTLVHDAVIKVIETTTAFIDMFTVERLNLVCLASGPGNDFIGLACALERYRDVINNFDVTVVDKSPGWKVIFKETIGILSKSGACKIEDEDASFVEADLTKFETWDNTMKGKLKQAHIVTLVKVLSNISEADHSKTLRNVIRYMEDDALLILIDCPLPFMELHRLKKFLYLVYKSEKQQFTFSKSITRFGYPNIKKCSAYVRVYRKRNSDVPIDE